MYEFALQNIREAQQTADRPNPKKITFPIKMSYGIKKESLSTREQFVSGQNLGKRRSMPEEQRNGQVKMEDEDDEDDEDEEDEDEDEDVDDDEDEEDEEDEDEDDEEDEEDDDEDDEPIVIDDSSEEESDDDSDDETFQPRNSKKIKFDSNPFRNNLRK